MRTIAALFVAPRGSIAKRSHPFPPMGFWDWWEQDYRLWGPSFVGGQTAPRWRARLSHRRSLPWVGRTKREAIATPAAFRDELLAMARGAE